MNGIIKTVKQARQYAEVIQNRTGEEQLIFKVPVGSMAYEVGYRFATCKVKEKELYLRDGAEFIE